MKQKLAFILFTFSNLMLAYSAYVYSPLFYGQNRWENSNVPLTFFSLFAILCIHFVFTGKMLSQEKFPKVMFVSIGVLLLTVAMLLPTLYAILFG